MAEPDEASPVPASAENGQQTSEEKHWARDKIKDTALDQSVRNAVNWAGPIVLGQLARLAPGLRAVLRRFGVEPAAEFVPPVGGGASEPPPKIRSEGVDQFAGATRDAERAAALVVVTKFTIGTGPSRRQEYWAAVASGTDVDRFPLTGSFWQIAPDTETVSERPEWSKRLGLWSTLVTSGLGAVFLLHKVSRVTGFAVITCGGAEPGARRYRVQVPVHSRKQLADLEKRVARLLRLSTPAPPIVA